MDEQGGWQAATLDLLRDLSGDGFCLGDAQPGVVVCDRLLKIYVVEGLPRKQAELTIGGGFVPVGQRFFANDGEERGMRGSRIFGNRRFHG